MVTGPITKFNSVLLTFLTLVLTWLPVSPLFAAQIGLQVLPEQLLINESFRLIFTATGSVDEEPDFSVLTTDFEILTNRSASQISLINGDYSRSKTWTLDLIPRRKGNLVIPPVPFGKDLSPAKAVAVKDATTVRRENQKKAADIFIKTTLKPRSPYVQQQTVMTVKLYRAINFSAATLSDPTSDGDLVIEKLGEDRSYPATHSDRRYEVVERKYTLLPKASGKITINPVQFEGRVGSSNRLGFDPFGGGKVVRVQSDPLTLAVRPVPAKFQGDHWLPAKDLSITAQWSEPEPEFRVGEPVTRIIRITAEGLAASQLPEIDLALPTGVRSYRDQPQLEARTHSSGIVSQREEKIALIPEQPGTLKLPAVTIPWWNTTTNRLEAASLPAVEVTVLPALDGSIDLSSPTTSLAPVPSTPELSAPAVDDSDPATSAPLVPSQGKLTRTLPWIIAAFFALGWAITVYLWRRDRRDRTQTNEDMGNRELTRNLRLACEASDKQFAAKALLAWGKLRHAERPPPSLESLAQREDGDLADQIMLLAKSLYSETDTNWIGTPLWVAVKNASKPSNLSQAFSKSSLAPLNPE
ncbi:MAG: hypothetical protein DRQ60_03880 [Gammaproteobacteria bacterium]|nr:MAG: hypothetical protein DRQ60_03880 [Gammaproteobacteria bacterium]